MAHGDYRPCPECSEYSAFCVCRQSIISGVLRDVFGLTELEVTAAIEVARLGAEQRQENLQERRADDDGITDSGRPSQKS